MQYKFNEFEFNSDSLVLSRSGESIDIRHNEAKLLALLISNADKVVSKEEILCDIWREKVVSEQAIFQNISHLRAIFGNDAIKTFPKRGYQWQLPVTQTLNIEQVNVQTEVLNPVAGGKFKYVTVLASIFALAMLVAVGTRFSANAPSPDNQFSIAIVEHHSPLLDFTQYQGLDIELLSSVSSAQFLQSPEWEYANLQSEHNVVMGGQLREFGNHYYYEFLLKGQAGEWKGVYSAPTVKELQKGITKHLGLDVVKATVSKAMLPDIKLAQLTIAVDQNPNDLILLSQLVDAYLNINQLDNALVMAEKLELVAAGEVSSKPTDHFYLATALLKQGEILKQKALYQSSESKLNAAMTLFERIGDNKRLSDTWYLYAQLKHVADDYEGVKSSLLKASDLAAQANDRIREIESLTYLSVLAYKNRQFDDQYHYLLVAEQRMKAYQLPDYQFAKIPFHYAIFAEYDADKVPHYKQVLEYCQLNPDFWVAQNSRENLVKYYLEYNRLDDAKSLVSDLKSNNAQNGYLHTLIALAEGKYDVFIRLAQETFEKAHLAGLYDLSADIAMLLLTEVNELDSRDFYRQFIEQNASKRWRLENKEQLMAWSM